MLKHLFCYCFEDTQTKEGRQSSEVRSVSEVLTGAASGALWNVCYIWAHLKSC